MTSTRNAAIRQYLFNRTSGVWCDAPDLSIGGWSVYAGVGENRREIASFVNEADAALIARAPSWLRNLVIDNERLTAELAATVKAKQENDERFQLERDQARMERDDTQAVLRRVQTEVGETFDNLDADSELNGTDRRWMTGYNDALAMVRRVLGKDGTP